MITGVDAASRPNRRRVAVAGGGTAGHVTSALAIMAAYQSGFDADIYFIGCEGGFETQLIPAEGFELQIIPGAPYARQNLRGKFRSVVALLCGTFAARRLLKKKHTDLVIGLGGYASMGSILAARSLGIRSVIHEANVFPGLANRMIGSLSDRVFVGWAEASGAFPPAITRVTGNPVRPAMAAKAEDAREGHEGPRRILITGGSLGSPFLNDKVPQLLARVRELGVPLEIRHQTGARETEKVSREYARLGIDARVEPFIDQMAEAYSQADYVIAAAGALTLAELAMFGLPSLLVPLATAANGHQIANARLFAERTGVTWILEDDWDTELLAGVLVAALGDILSLRSQTQRLRAMAAPNAARTLVESCEALMTA
jgi:UDP-N-acetylglucosamine--N-acetylmuramyl-(pentapeptide) pyrophosphoryl-undecaprenol N-acetylglucosamine transferase